MTHVVSIYWWGSEAGPPATVGYKRQALEARDSKRTLNPYMDVILRLFSLAGIFVSFGEGVCGGTCQPQVLSIIYPAKRRQ